MKYLISLQAKASVQAHRIHLRVYAKIGGTEQGKVRTHKNECYLSVSRENLYDTTCFYLTESGGTTDEVVVMTMEEQPLVKTIERQTKLY